MRTDAPAERVRARLEAAAGPELARRMPSGFERLGSVLVLRLPEELRPHAPLLGAAWGDATGVKTVLLRSGTVAGELRLPAFEHLWGDGTETEVVEHGIRYRFDAARVLFARGNKSERARAGRLTRPGETVVDLFAGIGYFALPALVHGRAARLFAVEKNPVSRRYLEENLGVNRVSGRARTFLGDNRSAPLPRGSADRVFLGYLPSALPWTARALELLRPSGGWLHLHLVVGTREGVEGAAVRARAAVEREGAAVTELAAREVKPYGPGRLHAVVDVRVGARP